MPKTTIRNIMKITKYFNINPSIANTVMKKYLAINVNIAIPMINKIMLNISHLTKTYGEKKAVDDLSLHIAPGEIYGFIGHNGACRRKLQIARQNAVNLFI